VTCGSFGLYPSYTARILNLVKEIHLYVLCSEKLSCATYTENVLPVKSVVLLIGYIKYIISVYHLVVRVALSFKAMQFPKLPSKLIFANRVLKKTQLSSLTYGIVCMNKRLTYITNEVPTSRHGLVNAAGFEPKSFNYES
jgi:hypothetical protein